MLADLASFEGAGHNPRLDTAALARDVFGPTAMLNILIAEQMAANQCRRIVGRISYFPNYFELEEQNRNSHWRSVGVSVSSWPGCRSTLLRHVVSENERIRIDVFVVGNSEARLFYERFGFSEQTKWRLYRIEADE